MASTAQAAESVKDFASRIATGVGQGDLLSLAIVGFLLVVVARFLFARWAYRLVSQLVIFGGLGFAVYWISGEAGDRWGETWERVVLWGGGAVVLLLFTAMIVSFAGNRRREREKAARKVTVGTPRGAARMVAQPGMHTVLGTPRPDTRRFEEPAIGSAPPGPTSGSRASATDASPLAAGQEPAREMTKLEELLKKVNVLGVNRDQTLLTVIVLILIAEFGVFSSLTFPPPSWKVGLVLFTVFFLAAVIFIRTSYKNYARGLTHLLIAALVAVGASVVLLVTYSGTPVCVDEEPGSNVTLADGKVLSDCAGSGAITFGWALNPLNYFASVASVAAITGVAFSILLSKGGG